MPDNAKAMLMASFAADAHSLGVHWIYNTNVIEKKYGRVETLLAPTLASYHRGKAAGQFTHYGDQTLLLLESIASHGFSPEQFSRDWRTYFKDYAGYIDGATKKTIANLDGGVAFDRAGSDSDDLGGATRLAPLVYAYRHDSAQLIPAVRTQTALTHGDDTVIATAELMARTTLQVLTGASPVEALQQETRVHFAGTPIEEWVAEGIDSAVLDTRQVVEEFGRGCQNEVVFPATVHLLARYPDDLKTALVENVMAGGESSNRGMLVGMILGAHLGSDAIQPWIDGMQARAKIEALIAQIDAR